MKKLLLIFLLTALLAYSCTTVREGYTARETDIITSVIQIPVVVDLIVDSVKVVGVSESSLKNFSDISDMKNMALADAIIKAGCDVIISPVYETKISKTAVTVNVTGYPAKYRNFRSITSDDIPLIDAEKARILGK